MAERKRQVVVLKFDASPDLAGAVDRARGLVPRAAWLRDLVEREVQRRVKGREVKR